MVDIEAAGDLPHRLAIIAPPHCLALLVRGELRLAAHFHAARLGPLATFAGARPDKVAFELCEARPARSASAVRVTWWCRPTRRLATGIRPSCR